MLFVAPTEREAEHSGFAVRRVVTGIDSGGRSVVVSDGLPPQTVGSSAGPAVSELLWLDSLPTSVEDGGEPPPGKLGGFPDGGALVCRVIRLSGFPAGTAVDETWLRMAGDDEVPGMHRSETLDFMVITAGHIVLGLDEGEYALGPGDAIVQRGTAHRWRVVGPEPCTYLSVLLSPDPSGGGSQGGLAPNGDVGITTAGPQRVVTTTRHDGRSAAISAGPISVLGEGARVSLVDLWQTGGPVSHVEQGGDPAGPWQLDPIGSGLAFRRVELAPGLGPEYAHLHATSSIDVGIVVSGELALGLLDAPPSKVGSGPVSSTVLAAGDCIVQRGAMHSWAAVGAVPAVLVTVMISVQPPRP